MFNNWWCKLSIIDRITVDLIQYELIPSYIYRFKMPDFSISFPCISNVFLLILTKLFRFWSNEGEGSKAKIFGKTKKNLESASQYVSVIRHPIWVLITTALS